MAKAIPEGLHAVTHQLTVAEDVDKAWKRAVERRRVQDAFVARMAKK